MGQGQVVQICLSIACKKKLNYSKIIGGVMQSTKLWQILNIHQLILKNIDDENAGRYRQLNILISGATTTPPDYTLLNDKMDRLVD